MYSHCAKMKIQIVKIRAGCRAASQVFTDLNVLKSTVTIYSGFPTYNRKKVNTNTTPKYMKYRVDTLDSVCFWYMKNLSAGVNTISPINSASK